MADERFMQHHYGARGYVNPEANARAWEYIRIDDTGVLEDLNALSSWGWRAICTLKGDYILLEREIPSDSVAYARKYWAERKDETNG